MIYLDTNIFYLFFFEDKKFSPGVKKVLESIQKGEERGLTNCLTFDELAYAILMDLIAQKYSIRPSQKIRETPEVILEFLPKIKEVFETILSFKNIEIAEASKGTVAVIPQLMEKLLLPRDCIHYQTMKEYDCRKILSTDSDFDRLKDVERVKPEEVR